MNGTYVIVGIIVLLVIFGIAQYNKLVRLNVAVDEGFAQIEVQLQRRGDLIPNLVETVKGYAKHEKDLFENVAAARSAWADMVGRDLKQRAGGVYNTVKKRI